MSVFLGMAAGYAAGAAAAEARTAGSSREAERVEERLERALLACEGMWTLMKEKLGVSDIELIEKINEIDLSDGRLDGKVRKTAVACPKCNRTISARFPKCMYCGQQIVHDPFA